MPCSYSSSLKSLLNKLAISRTEVCGIKIKHNQSIGAKNLAPDSHPHFYSRVSVTLRTQQQQWLQLIISLELHKLGQWLKLHTTTANSMPHTIVSLFIRKTAVSNAVLYLGTLLATHIPTCTNTKTTTHPWTYPADYHRKRSKQLSEK